MSQFFQGVTAGSLPPSVPLQFTEDDLTIAVPSANNLYVLSDSVDTDNSNGIQTTAISSDSIQVQITNRWTGTTTTLGAASSDIILFDMGSAATYMFEIRLAAFEPTTPAGAGYFITGTVRTDGATGTIVNIVDAQVDEEAALVTADWNVVFSGNNFVLRVTGVAGLTLYWSAVGLYTKASII